MSQHHRGCTAAWIGAVLASAAATPLHAEDGIFGRMWNNTTFNGTIRLDAAYRMTDLQNTNNQTNAPYQDVAVPRTAYLPPAFGDAPGQLVPGALSGLVPNSPYAWGDIPTPFVDTARRSDVIPQEDLEWNYATVRFTGEMDMKFTRDLRMNVRLRALYDPVVYDEFDANDVAGFSGGYSTIGGDRYADAGKPNYYEALDRNGRQINPLEIAGRDYMVDLPTFIINYRNSGWDFRLGNQQIAWGQAVFFRTFDVGNGLDLRRHLVIDRGIEEFEDERVPKLALRVAGQVTDTMVVDSFVGKFQPDILTNPNTPYNVIPSQFYKPFDNYFTGGYDNKIDAGIRLKSDFGTWGWQAMAVTRYNPLGTFKWAESGIDDKSLAQYGGLLGTAVEAAYTLKPTCGATQNPYDDYCRLYADTAEALSHTPFAIAPGGLYSDREWFAGAGSVRLNGMNALNAVIREFPAVRDLFATEVASVDEASALLNTFFIGSGGSLMGHVERDYHREAVFGLGASYITETSDINSFFNQIIFNLEAQYSPNRMLTADSLSGEYDKVEEYIVTLVAEKWYRYTEAFPAAYLVFQYMHRSETDLVGLNLDGYGGHVGGGNLSLDDPIKVADGIPNANYVVFAGFQPVPNRIFIFEWALLLDVRGGLLAQPLVKYNPGYNVSVDLFYNFTDGKLWGDGDDNLIRAIDWADEVGLRLSYQF